MANGKELPGFLIEKAAEGASPLMSGCATVLGIASNNTPSGDAPVSRHLRGIDYFGPRIAHQWLNSLGSLDRAEQADGFTRLACLPAAESQRLATEAVDRQAHEASAADKAVAVEYLAAIPLAVRRSLLPDPATGHLTMPATPADEAENSFLRLLPSDVPPFPINYVLPGTSYRLEELVGIGGFGAVYKASNRCEQNQPPRAIKFCLDPAMVPTLHREQTIFDRLMTVGESKWSNRIVRLYGYAFDAVPPFLVYEYVAGGDLTSHLSAVRQKMGRGFRPGVALELIRQIAEGLAFAHQQGLVHRDLKPANILVSGSAIKLTDFGIGGVVATHAARGGAAGSARTHTTAAGHAFLFRGSGTPLYMSPEQRRGENPDPRHDIYSMGVVWYQLLIGDVTRELHPGWPDELIEEFQIPASHIELIQRCVGYYKKRPANAGQLLELLSAPSSAASNGSAKVQAPKSAEHQAAELEKFRRILADQIDHEKLSEARATLAFMLRLCPGDSETLEARDFVEKRLGIVRARASACFTTHKGWVRAVAISSDGLRGLSASDDATLRVWDLPGKREMKCLTGHTGAVMSVAMTPDGRQAVSGSWDGSARLWDLDAGKEIRCFKGPWKVIKSVALTADGKRVLFGCDDHNLHLWDLTNGKELLCLSGHTDLVQSVRIAPDCAIAVSGSDDNTVRLWDLKAGKELRRLEGHTDSVLAVAISSDGKWVLSGSSDNSLRQWEVESGREMRQLVGHANWVNAVDVALNNKHVLSASGGELTGKEFKDGADTTIRLWDLSRGQEVMRCEGHTATVTGVAISGDGRQLISSSLDKTVRLWDLAI